MTKYFSFFIGMLIFFVSHSVIASCTLSGAVSNANYGFVQSNITVGAEVPNGTTLSTQSSRPMIGNMTVNCSATGNFSVSRTYASGANLIPSGFTGQYGGDIYKTNVPGLGFYMYAVNLPFPNSTAACVSENSCTQGSSSFYIALLIIKIGNIAPGSILNGADLPCVNMKLGQSGALADVVNTCFNGTLAVQTLTCNTPADIPVALGAHEVSEFSGVGSATGWKDASIKLTQCPPFYGDQVTGIAYSNATSASVTNIKNLITLVLSPIGTVRDPVNGIINLSTDSTAAGVGIQLASGTLSSSIMVNFSSVTQASISLPNNTGSSNVTVPLLARYVQIDSRVTPGTANGKLNYTINYY